MADVGSLWGVVEASIVYFSQEHKFLLPFILSYLFAGLQTWRLVFLLDPNSSDALSNALRRGDGWATVIYVIFALTWPAFLGAAYIIERRENRGVT